MIINDLDGGGPSNKFNSEVFSTPPGWSVLIVAAITAIIFLGAALEVTGFYALTLIGGALASISGFVIGGVLIFDEDARESFKEEVIKDDGTRKWSTKGLYLFEKSPRISLGVVNQFLAGISVLILMLSGWFWSWVGILIWGAIVLYTKKITAAQEKLDEAPDCETGPGSEE